MKLSFLIRLLLLVILIVGVYMVFTNSVTGRMKIIMVVFLVIIGIYLFNKLPFLKGYNEIIESPESAKDSRTIEQKELKKSNGHLTLSTWVYIDDWNYRYGEKKIILRKGANGESMPEISLDEYKNDLIITLDTMVDSSEDFKSAMVSQLESVHGAGNVDGDVECSEGYIKYTPKNSNTSVYYDTNNTTTLSCDNDKEQTIKIQNINLQKWVHILVSISDRNVDVYMNGKLVKSKVFNNIVNTAKIDNGNIVISPDGGFGGYISKTQYYPYFVTPKKAWSIYRDGFGDVLASALDKYNLSVSFYEDSVEKKKYWVF